MQKQLRSMSAIVHTRALDGWGFLFLRSYDTIVAAYYPIANALYFSPYYGCSHTTLKHIRAFLKDYANVTVSIPELLIRLEDMTFNLDHRSIMLDGRRFNVFTCSQQQILYMFNRSQEI